MREVRIRVHCGSDSKPVEVVEAWLQATEPPLRYERVEEEEDEVDLEIQSDLVVASLSSFSVEELLRLSTEVAKVYPNPYKRPTLFAALLSPAEALSLEQWELSACGWTCISRSEEHFPMLRCQRRLAEGEARASDQAMKAFLKCAGIG